MSTYKVVIGANFGDEGKGLITDYFTSQLGGCYVVRFNGGAQASHTVVTPSGSRHVFSHFGAGSFVGAPTYLSKYFLVNPMVFMRELGELRKLIIIPNVFVDRGCLVTTPYDMFINQSLENSRVGARHGSCGIGIHETMVRSENPEYLLTAHDLEAGSWKKILDRIGNVYYPKRMAELGLKMMPFDNHKFMEIFQGCVRAVTFSDIGRLRGRDIVFEGAQGLCLDQNHRFFPHVTHSNTGYENARAIIEEIRSTGDSLEVAYVTRTYMTRHGRGPFPNETQFPPYRGVVEDTNVFNKFQEEFRFGHLNIDLLANEIRGDCVKNDLFAFSLSVTCLDQISEGETMHYIEDREMHSSTVKEFLIKLWLQLPYERVLTSFGKTRSHIQSDLITRLAFLD
jgi:adenylosuccinate synthase